MTSSRKKVILKSKDFTTIEFQKEASIQGWTPDEITQVIKDWLESDTPKKVLEEVCEFIPVIESKDVEQEKIKAICKGIAKAYSKRTGKDGFSGSVERNLENIFPELLQYFNSAN